MQLQNKNIYCTTYDSARTKKNVLYTKKNLHSFTASLSGSNEYSLLTTGGVELCTTDMMSDNNILQNWYSKYLLGIDEDDMQTYNNGTKYFMFDGTGSSKFTTDTDNSLDKSKIKLCSSPYTTYSAYNENKYIAAKDCTDVEFNDLITIAFEPSSSYVQCIRTDVYLEYENQNSSAKYTDFTYYSSMSEDTLWERINTKQLSLDTKINIGPVGGTGYNFYCSFNGTKKAKALYIKRPRSPLNYGKNNVGVLICQYFTTPYQYTLFNNNGRLFAPGNIITSTSGYGGGQCFWHYYSVSESSGGFTVII